MKEKPKEVTIGTMFSYLQHIVESMENVTRWDLRAKIDGQTAVENVLQHSYKTALFTFYCATLENEHRSDSEQLNIEMLIMMALVHDIAEIAIGDVPYFKKQKGDKTSEYRAFCDIMQPMPPCVRERLITAFCHAFRGTEFSMDSRESRFFGAVEELGHYKRGLHECRAGNIHFAPKLFELHTPAVLAYAKEFSSLRDHINPFKTEADEYLKEFKDRREEYRDKFIRAGNPANAFPF